jgi:hypothetical protein
MALRAVSLFARVPKASRGSSWRAEWLPARWLLLMAAQV